MEGSEVHAAARQDLAAVLSAFTAERAARGLGVREAARAACVSPGTVRNLEAGERLPTWKAAARYAQALDLRLVTVQAEGPSAVLEPGAVPPSLPGAFFRPLLRRANDVESRQWDLDVEAVRWLRLVASEFLAARLRRGLSDEAAARSCGLSPKTVRQVAYFEGWPAAASVAVVARFAGRHLVARPAADGFPAPGYSSLEVSAQQQAGVPASHG